MEYEEHSLSEYLPPGALLFIPGDLSHWDFVVRVPKVVDDPTDALAALADSIDRTWSGLTDLQRGLLKPAMRAAAKVVGWPDSVIRATYDP